MTIDADLLRKCSTANLELLARSLGVVMPSPLHSDHVRHRILVRDVAAAIRESARVAVGAASVVAAAVALGVM
jgi:hypothetical protein